MAAKDRRMVDAASARVFRKRHVRRHLVLKHPTDLDRVRRLLVLSERRRNQRPETS